MIIGTTPTFTFKFKRNSTVNMQTATYIVVSFKQGLYQVDITNPDVIDSKTVSVTLTEEQSYSFTLDKKIEVQLNWYYNESGRQIHAATKVQTIELQKQLLRQVI